VSIVSVAGCSTPTPRPQNRRRLERARFASDYPTATSPCARWSTSRVARGRVAGCGRGWVVGIGDASRPSSTRAIRRSCGPRLRTRVDGYLTARRLSRWAIVRRPVGGRVSREMAPDDVAARHSPVASPMNARGTHGTKCYAVAPAWRHAGAGVRARAMGPATGRYGAEGPVHCAERAEGAHTESPWRLTAGQRHQRLPPGDEDETQRAGHPVEARRSSNPLRCACTVYACPTRFMQRTSGAPQRHPGDAIPRITPRVGRAHAHPRSSPMDPAPTPPDDQAPPHDHRDEKPGRQHRHPHGAPPATPTRVPLPRSHQPGRPVCLPSYQRRSEFATRPRAAVLTDHSTGRPVRARRQSERQPPGTQLPDSVTLPGYATGRFATLARHPPSGIRARRHQ
jgi:hypothetical protein